MLALFCIQFLLYAFVKKTDLSSVLNYSTEINSLGAILLSFAALSWLETKYREPSVA